MRSHDFIVPNIAQGAFPELRGKAFEIADVLVLCAIEHQQPKLKAPPGKAIVRLGFDDDSYRPVPPEAAKIFHAHAAQLARQALNGKKLLFTCHMGLNRSGLMCALTLMHAYRMSPADAIALIRGRRHKDCLGNPMFEQFLMNQRRAA